MGKFWFNVSTGQVEEDDNTSRKDDLMGPYDTREAAQNAVSSAHARTEAWDEEDRREAERDGRDPDQPGLLG